MLLNGVSTLLPNPSPRSHLKADNLSVDTHVPIQKSYLITRVSAPIQDFVNKMVKCISIVLGRNLAKTFTKSQIYSSLSHHTRNTRYRDISIPYLVV